MIVASHDIPDEPKFSGSISPAIIIPERRIPISPQNSVIPLFAVCQMTTGLRPGPRRVNVQPLFFGQYLIARRKKCFYSNLPPALPLSAWGNSSRSPYRLTALTSDLIAPLLGASLSLSVLHSILVSDSASDLHQPPSTDLCRTSKSQHVCRPFKFSWSLSLWSLSLWSMSLPAGHLLLLAVAYSHDAF